MALANPLVTAEELALLAQRTRPQALSAGRMLPVAESLRGVLPGLRRGSVVGVGSRMVLHALIAEASVAGSWTVFAGVGSLGLAAAAEAGVVLARTAVIDGDGEQGLPPDVLAAVIDAVDLVVIGPRARVSGDACRRLQARARERGAVLLISGRRTWPGVTDLDVSVRRIEAVGVEHGAGHVHGVRAEIEVFGRGAAARPTRNWVWIAGGPAPRFADEGVDEVVDEGVIEEYPPLQLVRAR
jgi:hypothetical protein